MRTWIATVTNTKTGEKTTRIGQCMPELVAFNAVRMAEENTKVTDLPDRWEIVVELFKEKAA